MAATEDSTGERNINSKALRIISTSNPHMVVLISLVAEQLFIWASAAIDINIDSKLVGGLISENGNRSAVSGRGQWIEVRELYAADIRNINFLFTAARPSRSVILEEHMEEPSAENSPELITLQDRQIAKQLTGSAD